MGVCKYVCSVCVYVCMGVWVCVDVCVSRCMCVWGICVYGMYGYMVAWVGGVW